MHTKKVFCVIKIVFMFTRFIEKLYIRKYLSTGIIFVLDMLASLLSSAFAIFIAKWLLVGKEIYGGIALIWLAEAFVFSWVFFVMFKTYRSIIRHSTLGSLARLGAAVFCKFIALALCVGLFFGSTYGPSILLIPIFDLLLTYCLLVVMRVTMVVFYGYLTDLLGKRKIRHRVLIYGTSDKSVSMITRLKASSHYQVVGFISPNAKLQNTSISAYKVYSFSDNKSVRQLKSRLDVVAVLFATDHEAREEQEHLIRYCTDNGLKIFISPSIDEVIDGKVMKSPIREIKIEDLLGRDEIKISMNEIIDNFRGKTVMVTGAAGSIGSELCRQLAMFGVKELVLYDNAETPMHNLRLELEERYPDLRFVPVIGDVRLLPRLDFVFRKYHPQVVFHAAAYKHVPLMEENPCEATLVNVTGSKYVADKCIEYNVEKMVMISTDKAVNPTNIMGCTKRLAEIYVQSLGLAIEQGKHEGRTKFVTTRFGNVLGSNGSVIPRFREQIAKGGPVTVTHPEITRFFMTIPEACRLVMEAATMSTGNQIFVFDMGESVKITHLATRMIELAGLVPGKDVSIEYTGLRPGEKLYEEVLSNTENTIPTNHNRIRIAKVREYDYNDALSAVERLEELSRAVEIPDMVRLMKVVVPEFKSQNSKFEKYDK